MAKLKELLTLQSCNLAPIYLTYLQEHFASFGWFFPFLNLRFWKGFVSPIIQLIISF